MIRKKVVNYLIGNGFRPQYDGFELMVQGLMILRKTRPVKFRLIEDFYRPLAIKNNTTINCIDRDVRYMMEVCKCPVSTKVFIKGALVDLL